MSAFSASARFLARKLADPRCLIALASASICLLASGSRLGAQDGVADGEVVIMPPLPVPCPTMEARDIRDEGVLGQRIRVFFHWFLPVLRDSLGDGDIVVSGPSGGEQHGLLISVEEVAEPFPIPLLPLPEWENDWIRFEEPFGTLVATYEVSSPAGDGSPWSSADNGTYAVRLVEDAVALVDGSALPPKLLGGFRVLIGVESLPICPTEAEVAIRREPIIHPDGPAIDDHGLLPPALYDAEVAIAFAEAEAEMRDWGVPEREGNTFIATIRAVQLVFPGGTNGGEAGGNDDEAARSMFRHGYHLGPLEPGDYRFVLQCGDARVAVHEWNVPPVQPPDDADEQAPGARLSVRNVAEPGAASLRLRVDYEDRSGVAARSLGDGDIVVLSPCFELEGATDFPCDWETQPGRLVERQISDDGRHVTAVYEIRAPDGGWSHHHNGFYPVVLAGGAVCDLAGNCSGRTRLGGFEVAILPDGSGDPPVAADATIRIDASDPAAVKASVHIVYRDYFRVVETSVRHEGSRILLETIALPIPVAAIFPPPPPGEEMVEFKIGALEPGTYAAAFRMNGAIYDVAEFTVGEPPPPPIETDVMLRVDSSGPEAVAHAVVDFTDPYVVLTDSGNPRLLEDGRTIRIDASAERVTFVQEPDGLPVEARYDLGPLPPGSYHLVFRINRIIEAGAWFSVGDDPDPVPAQIELAIDAGADPVVALATIQFEDHYRIVDTEVARSADGQFLLLAKADGPLPILAPIPPPPVTHSFALGSLPAGSYAAAFVLNGTVRARTEFRVSGDPPPPPHGVVNVAFIEVTRDDTDEHTAEVGLAISDPRVAVTDWGTVERTDDGFAIDIRVGRSDEPPLIDPVPADDVLPEDLGGVALSPDGQLLIGGFPVRLERHRYALGLLAPGDHVLRVSINGQLAARRMFTVGGIGPTARLSIEDIEQSSSEPHGFAITFSDPSGLDHEAIRKAAVTVAGPDGLLLPAVLIDYASTDDVPGSGAFARYGIHPPGGRWDADDRGRYLVSIDAESVRDLDGNSLAHEHLGGFAVRIWPEPPAPPHPAQRAQVRVSMSEGRWIAEVAIQPRDGWTIEPAEWGEMIARGHALSAKAELIESPLPDPNPEVDPIPPIQGPITHTYTLGMLPPGHYLFLFRSSLGHFGLAPVHVPGVEGDMIEAWRRLAHGDDEAANDGIHLLSGDDDHDGTELFGEYAWAMDPRRADKPEIGIEVMTGEDGRPHLGLRFRRPIAAFDVRYVIEGSRDLHEWHEVSGEAVEILSREPDFEGFENVLVCLRDAMEDSDFAYLRVRAIRMAPDQ